MTSYALPEFKGGSVWLVGAGPGDPGLLTLLAHHAIQKADIIIYDALVHTDILTLAHPKAQLEFAGKRGGTPSPLQKDITLRLITLARQGKKVARLKGGDPFVFGRGTEEALALVEAKIPFRVIPGITAGVGALAYAGIPLTSRETNSAFAFIAGHDKNMMLPNDLEWKHLVKAVPVLVFYMAINHLKLILDSLSIAGKAGSEPVALISKGTTKDQNVLVSTLDQLHQDVTQNALQISTPALLVVGPTIYYHEILNWYGHLSE
jgi:uroporphyrin-III C-methyltransferase